MLACVPGGLLPRWPRPGRTTRRGLLCSWASAPGRPARAVLCQRLDKRARRPLRRLPPAQDDEHSGRRRKQGGRRGAVNNGRSDRELMLLDPKRVRRIIANRMVGARLAALCVSRSLPEPLSARAGARGLRAGSAGPGLTARCCVGEGAVWQARCLEVKLLRLEACRCARAPAERRQVQGAQAALHGPAAGQDERGQCRPGSARAPRGKARW